MIRVKNDAEQTVCRLKVRPNTGYIYQNQWLSDQIEHQNFLKEKVFQDSKSKIHVLQPINLNSKSFQVIVKDTVNPRL